MKITKAHKDLSYLITGAAKEVHKAIGPGLLESVYHKCMIAELKARKLNFTSELIVPINYKGQKNHNILEDRFIY